MWKPHQPNHGYCWMCGVSTTKKTGNRCVEIMENPSSSVISPTVIVGTVVSYLSTWIL